jgi:hypothetical protein
MGANATTFVPAYVAGEVLTAADLFVTNSGIPVFATTVTRDAAFGGTGEKTLAEGQFAYIEATNTTQYYDGAAWQPVGGGLTQLVGQTAFTATTGVTVSNVFSSTYSNYLLTVVTTVNGADDVLMQFTVGGTATTANYNYQTIFGDGSSPATSRSTGNSSIIINRSSAGTFTQVTNLTIFNPNVSDITMFQINALNQQSATTPYQIIRYGNQSASTQFDGFKLLSANNITGYYTLYGYQK